MFCSKCGKQAEGEFCWNCGAKLYTLTDNSAALETPSRKLAEYGVFKASNEYEILGGTLQIDEKHQMMRILFSSGGNTVYWHWSDIADSELVRNDGSVSNTSTSFVLTRAPAGSLIYDEDAVIGSAVSRRKEQSCIETLYIRLSIKNGPYDTILIDFVRGGSVIHYDDLINKAEEIMGLIRAAQNTEPSEYAYAREVVSEEDQARPRLPEKNIAPTPDGLKWRCPKCDSLNQGLTCKICGADKPQTAIYIDADGNTVDVRHKQIFAAENADKSNWYCPNCDYKNRGSSKTCINCGSPKGEAKVKRRLFGIFKK